MNASLSYTIHVLKLLTTMVFSISAIPDVSMLCFRTPVRHLPSVVLRVRVDGTIVPTMKGSTVITPYHIDVNPSS